MNRSFPIEDAFQKIRSQTGITDVQEIVHKFLTREHTYAQLLTAVSDNERRFEALRESHEQKRSALQALQVEHDALLKA